MTWTSTRGAGRERRWSRGTVAGAVMGLITSAPGCGLVLDAQHRGDAGALGMDAAVANADAATIDARSSLDAPMVEPALDSAVLDSAVLDSAVLDSTVVTSPDAGGVVPGDGGPVTIPDAARPDADVLRDAGSDAGGDAGCGPCTPSGPCESATCEGTTCRRTLTSGAVCRAPSGPCEGDAICNGADPRCPTNPLLRGVVCRPAIGPCDQAELCGGDPACPPDVLRGDGEVCGAGGCRSCTGRSPDCIGDVRVNAVCPGGICGLGGTCLAGAMICVDPSNPCRVGTLVSGSCVISSTAAPGTHCRIGDGQCVGDSLCDDTGMCVDPVIAVGDPCDGWCPVLGRVSGVCQRDGLCAVSCPGG